MVSDKNSLKIVHTSGMSKTANRLRALIGAVGLLTVFPTLFMTFDPHHDGLVLSTIRLTRESLTSGAPLPFNQYGPAWSLFGTLITFFVSAEYLMIALRILTLGIYVLTAILIYRFAIRFLSERVAIISVAIYVLSNPFNSIYQSGFMAWPSIYVAPILLLILFTLNASRLGGGVAREISRSLWVSFLILFLFFTRLQIGILIIIFILFFTLVYNSRREFFTFLSVFFACLSLSILVFIRFDMFQYVLLDQFEYGIFHAASDMKIVIPALSLLGALCWASFFLALNRFDFSTQVNKFGKVLITSIICALALIVAAIALRRNLDFFALSSTIQRRLWVALFIAAAGITVYKLVFIAISWGLKGNKPERLHISLALMSLIGFTQSFPLFDQMHVWWGSVPLILLVSIPLEAVYVSATINLLRRSIAVLDLLLSLNASLLIQSLARENLGFDSKGLGLLRDQPSVVTNYDRLNNFVTRLIPESSVVQNICPDANVFLTDRDYRSSSYLSVFWQNFSDTQYMESALKSKPGSYILDCTGVVKSAPDVFGISIERIIGVSEMKDIYGRHWSLYYYR